MHVIHRFVLKAQWNVRYKKTFGGVLSVPFGSTDVQNKMGS